MTVFVNRAHLIQMPLIVAFLQETGHDPLIHPRYRGGKNRAPLFVAPEKLFRQYQVAHTDRRSDGFGKGSDINDLSVAVVALERRNRFSLIAKFTVIIVLDDVALLGAVRPFQELQPRLIGITVPKGY